MEKRSIYSDVYFVKKQDSTTKRRSEQPAKSLSLQQRLKEISEKIPVFVGSFQEELRACFSPIASQYPLSQSDFKDTKKKVYDDMFPISKFF